MASYRENASFADAIIDKSSILDLAIDWISSNLSPGDVFDDDTLAEWASESGWVREDED